MPAVCRAGIDKHACGAVDTEGSGDVFTNGAPTHRLGDKDSHGASMIEGSGTVFVNGKPITRIGDKNGSHSNKPVHQPNPEVTGSPDVFAGG